MCNRRNTGIMSLSLARGQKPDSPRLKKRGGAEWQGQWGAGAAGSLNVLSDYLSRVWLMFRQMISGRFADYTPSYNAFVKAILQLFPLDTYVEHPVNLMEIVPGDTAETPIRDSYKAIVKRADDRGRRFLGR